MEGYNCLYNQVSLNKSDVTIIYVGKTLQLLSWEIVRIASVQCIEIKVKQNDNNYIISAIYRSPSINPDSF